MIQLPLKGVYDAQPYEINLTIPAREALRNLPEKMHAEAINNELYVEDTGSTIHAETTFELSWNLAKHVRSKKLGKVFQESIGIYWKDNAVVPDIVFVSNRNLRFLRHQGLLGPADLCIEVLSPSTKRYNFTTKKKFYEKCKIREYWLVDPITKQTHGFLLRKGKYGEPLVLNGQVDIRILKTSIKI